MTFRDVVEAVKKLSNEEKNEIKSLIEHYLIEDKREEIYHNYLISKENHKEGKLNFCLDIDDLMESLEN